METKFRVIVHGITVESNPKQGFYSVREVVADSEGKAIQEAFRLVESDPKSISESDNPALRLEAEKVFEIEEFETEGYGYIYYDESESVPWWKKPFAFLQSWGK